MPRGELDRRRAARVRVRLPDAPLGDVRRVGFHFGERARGGEGVFPYAVLVVVRGGEVQGGGWDERWGGGVLAFGRFGDGFFLLGGFGGAGTLSRGGCWEMGVVETLQLVEGRVGVGYCVESAVDDGARF